MLQIQYIGTCIMKNSNNKCSSSHAKNLFKTFGSRISAAHCWVISSTSHMLFERRCHGTDRQTDRHQTNASRLTLDTTHLCIPDFIQILESQRLLFDHKADNFLQFLDILRLMQIVSQHDRQDIVCRYPLLCHSMQTATADLYCY